MNNQNFNGGLFKGQFKWEYVGVGGKIGFPPETDIFPSVTHVLNTLALEEQILDLIDGRMNRLRQWQIETPQKEKDRVLKRGNDIDDVVETYRIDSVFCASRKSKREHIVFSEFLSDENTVRLHNWISQDSIKPIASEIPVWSNKLGLKGYFDLLVFKDNLLNLVDNKGTTKDTKIGHSTYELKYRKQAVFYREALKEMVTGTPLQKWIVEQMGLTKAQIDNMQVALNYFVDGEDANRYEVLSELKLKNALAKLVKDVEAFNDDIRFPVSITRIDGNRLSWKRYPSVSGSNILKQIIGNVQITNQHDVKPIQRTAAGKTAISKAKAKRSWELQ